MISCMVILLLCLLYIKTPVENEKTKSKILVIITISTVMFCALNLFICLESPVSSNLYKELEYKKVDSKYITDIQYENENSDIYIPTIKAIYDTDGNEIPLENVDKIGSTTKYSIEDAYANINREVIGKIEKTTFKYELKDKSIGLFYFVPEIKDYTILDIEIFF